VTGDLEDLETRLVDGLEAGREGRGHRVLGNRVAVARRFGNEVAARELPRTGDHFRGEPEAFVETVVAIVDPVRVLLAGGHPDRVHVVPDEQRSVGGLRARAVATAFALRFLPRFEDRRRRAQLSLRSGRSRCGRAGRRARVLRSGPGRVGTPLGRFSIRPSQLGSRLGRIGGRLCHRGVRFGRSGAVFRLGRNNGGRQGGGEGEGTNESGAEAPQERRDHVGLPPVPASIGRR
jgi:hypothetical protein